MVEGAMGDQKGPPSSSTAKFNSHLQISHVFHFLFFIVGLSLGVTASLYIKSFSLNIHATLLSPISLPPPPPPPSPPPSPPAPPRPSPPPNTPPTTPNTLTLPEKQFLMHNMDDAELFWRASLVPRIEELPYERVPKLAFMFLTKGPLCHWLPCGTCSSEDMKGSTPSMFIPIPYTKNQCQKPLFSTEEEFPVRQWNGEKHR